MAGTGGRMVKPAASDAMNAFHHKASEPRCTTWKARIAQHMRIVSPEVSPEGIGAQMLYAAEIGADRRESLAKKSGQDIGRWIPAE